MSAYRGAYRFRSPYGRRGIWGILFGRVLAERGF